MSLPPFELERFFARFEFEVPVNLCASDVETLPMQALIDGADPEARALWDNLTLGYTESLGHKLLRDEIAKLYGLTRDEVVVFSGAEEAIYVWARSCLAEGDQVACPRPAYQSLFQVARAQGCAIAELGLSSESGGPTRFDMAALEGQLDQDTTAIVINTPHNPTGAHMTIEQLHHAVQMAGARGAALVCDEAYRFLEPSADLLLPGAASLADHAVSIGVMSKAFGLPGLRIGWIATRNRSVLENVTSYKDYTSICASGPSEILAIMALRGRETILERNRAIVRGNRALMDTFVETHSDLVTWNPPTAGCVAMVRLLDGRDSTEFAERAAREHGVLVMPSAVFGADASSLRIGLGRANCVEGLERFSRALHA